MRLSEWCQLAPFKESASAKVIAVVEQAVVALGADPDPECWVAWGDDPAVRYLIFAPTPAGLAQFNVRVNAPGEGPRAAGKLTRWNRVQLGELGVEIQGGHRLVSFQIETQVLNGVDEVAERIADFALWLFAGVDGRPAPVARRAGKRATASAASAKSAAKPGGRAASAKAQAKPAVKPAGRAAAKPAGRAAATPAKGRAR
jgi:hypothetical protein